jgi:para-aminobenzoate synthetase / 4-amino-4-deoxychorismate lyase
VFETLLVRDGRVVALDAHLARLERSAQTLYDAPLPHELEQLVTDRAAATAGARRARLDIVPNNGRLHPVITISDVPPRRPVTVAPRVLPGGLGPHKWRDRRLVEDSIPTPLLVDSDGSVLEAAWANVWLLDGATLTTPPLDGRILPGVTRARLIAAAPALGLSVREAPVTLEQARAAPTVFLTSSLRLAVAAGFAADPPEHPEVDRIAAALA